MLFSRQTDLSPELYPELAKQLALNLATFEKDMNESTIAAKIDSDAAAGNSININSTPTFFLNGTKLVVNQPEDLRQTVEKALSDL